MANTADEASSKPHLVVLVHGIRTRAEWYIAVRDALRAEGFEVELSNYGRFDLVRFLLPVPFFKARARADIEGDIRDAMKMHGVQELSVIAHSFGTYVVAQILKNESDITFRHIVFCGSVVKARFPFEQYETRYKNIVNEVGTRDIWPILAESVTWGYGPTGAFGFSRPRVFDRYHRGLSHSAFLNAAFCRAWWIPVLRGEKPASKDEPERPPWWLGFLSVVHFKHVLVTLLSFWLAASSYAAREQAIDIPSQEVYFAGEKIGDLVKQADQPCRPGWSERLKQQRCMATTSIQSAVDSLAVCRPKATYFKYRDPTIALQTLARDVIPCLDVDGVAQRNLRVGVNGARAVEARAANGKTLWLCQCDDAGRQKALEMAGQ